MSQLPEQDRRLLYRNLRAARTNEEMRIFCAGKPDSVRMRRTRAKRRAAALMKGDGSHDRRERLLGGIGRRLLCPADGGLGEIRRANN